MITLRFNELAQLLNSGDSSSNPALESIVTDSRKAQPGSLFAALPGERVDGHDFADTAVSLGAVALLVSRRLDLPVPQLVVDDVLVALGRIAALLRSRAHPQVVGITGSNGKTTVKEMVAGILRIKGEVLATEGNYNNELGLPLTLFGLDERHRYAVLEMGASKPGDIAYLADIAQPDVGIITNIGPAHLEGFGSVEGVARTKGEMYAGLPVNGCAIMNADEPWLPMWQGLNQAGRTITFGASPESDVRFDDSGDRPRILTVGGDIELQLALPGRHNLYNAAAATAAALALDIEMESIRQGLERIEPVPGRLNVLHTSAGWTVIDDSYNANPASLYSALQVLTGLQGESWLVLGDMKELGTGSHKMHREVGENARTMGVQRLFATGEMSEHTVDAFGKGAKHFASKGDLESALRHKVRPGVNCLVKGSRSMGMESVVKAVLEESGRREAG